MYVQAVIRLQKIRNSLSIDWIMTGYIICSGKKKIMPFMHLYGKAQDVVSAKYKREYMAPFLLYKNGEK